MTVISTVEVHQRQVTVEHAVVAVRCCWRSLTKLTDDGDAGPHHVVGLLGALASQGHQGVGDGGGEDGRIDRHHLCGDTESNHDATTL